MTLGRPCKRALLVGINYFGTANELRGCINDVNNVKQLLLTAGYEERNIIVLSDDDKNGNSPTKENILHHFRRLTAQTKAKDTVFFHFSGHGTQTYDFGGDEADRHDEAICTVDMQLITDDQIRALLVNPLPSSCTLNILLDCCHSGTGCDVRYLFEDCSTYTGPQQQEQHQEVKFNPQHWKRALQSRHNHRASTRAPLVVCISGCRDSQTSADSWDAHRDEACGAMTRSFLNAWEEVRDSCVTANLARILQHMTCSLRLGHYTQRPQLSLSKFSSAHWFRNGEAIMKL